MSALASLLSIASCRLDKESILLLMDHVLSGEFRDEEFTPDTYKSIVDCLAFLSKSRFSDKGQLSLIHDLRSCLLRVLSSDEFKGDEASMHFSDQTLENVVNRANPSRLVETDVESECLFIEEVTRVLYTKLVSRRSKLRSTIGGFLQEYIQIPTRTSHLTPILNVTHQVIRGMASIDRSLFVEILLPLHKPNGWSFWDRQTPILAEYHKPLVQCCFAMVEKDITLSTLLVDYILTHCFPPVNQSNTAKELLLLFEVSKFLDLVDLERLIPKLMVRILDSVSSENAQVVQSVLVFWKSPPSDFPKNFEKFLSLYLDSLLIALFRGTGEPHWNPTVNKMSLLVLKSLQTSNGELFVKSCDRIIPESSFKLDNGITTPLSPSLAAPVMATNQPPLGITGVAPWTNEPIIVPPSSRTGKSLRGYAAMKEYMRLLEPSPMEKDDKPWQAALSLETPTLLPDLKFHNLVFGRDLGVGSFSVVRYARVVKPRKFLSQWDEVAVKIISYETIKSHNYGENILREISCLRRLSHPSIARLVSSFRWRDGIYLVLEYGSLGDLHTYIRQRGGPLPELNAKIIVGEITTALAAVHEAGFVYGDLKPENVVITATRHVKLADFGACRPFTSEAKQLLLNSRDDLENMRSGDWKEESSSIVIELSDDQILCPKTFEGTTAYLSPEIVSHPGVGPSILSDAYALGMTTYFILRGRLPQWAAIDESSVTMFDPQSLIDSDPLFATGEVSLELREFILGLVHPDPDARWTVQEAMTREWFSDVQPVRSLFSRPVPENHLGGAEEGSSTENVGGAWEKRQLSKIWTAQPVDYALVRTRATEAVDLVITETEVERGCRFIQ